MANSAGVNNETGYDLTGWAHVEQSIKVILTTPIGSRVMRRDFGSSLPDLVDRKLTSRGVLAVYSAAAIALAKYEPRFRLTRASVLTADHQGFIGLVLFGTYFPRGHVGDYTVAEDQRTRIML